MDYIARQAPLSLRFSRQEYWSVLSFPSPGGLPDPRLEPRSSALQADSLAFEPLLKPPVLTVRTLRQSLQCAKSPQLCPTLCDPMYCVR